MKTDRGWINLGLLLLAAALFLTVYNRMASYEAGETSRQVIEQLCQTLPTESAAETEAPAIPEYLLDAGREMPVQTIDGKDYIGVLTIPSLELELPVIKKTKRGYSTNIEVLEALRGAKLEPKRICTVHARVEKPPRVVLIEAVKGAGRNLHWLPPLILYDADGAPSARLQEIYGDVQANAAQGT